MPEAEVALRESAAAQPASPGRPGSEPTAFSFESATDARATRSRPPIDAAQKAKLEEAEKMAMTLQADLRLAERLGVDTSEATATLASAALSIARGSADEAMGLLGNHAQEVARDVQWKFEASVTEIEEREGKLREDGIAADVARQVSRARSAFEQGHKLEAVQALATLDQHLAVLEREWRTLKETLLRVDALKIVAEKLGLDTQDVTTKLAQVRTVMSDVYADTATIQEASNLASGALVLLHERLREKVAVEAQLAVVEIKDQPVPGDAQEELESIVHIVLRHAKAGRIKEAAEELVRYKDVRQSALRVRPKPSPEPTAAAAIPSPAPAPVVESVAEKTLERTAPAPETPAAAPVVEAAPAAAAAKGGAPAEPTPAPSPAAAVPASEAATPPSREGPNLKDLLAEARELAAELKTQQKAGKDVKAAAAALKEATVKLKGGELEAARLALQRAQVALTAI